MKKIIYCLFFIIFSLQAQEQPNQSIMPRIDFVNSSDEEHFQLLIRGMNQWAFNLYTHLSRQPGNFCISPFSIAAVLTMVGDGAKQSTSAEIQKLLRYPAGLNLLVGDLNLLLLKVPQIPKNGAQLLSANAIWIQKDIPLLVSFQQVIQRDFQINVGVVNFEEEAPKAVHSINTWGSKQTKNRINQLIFPQDVNRQTHLVLTSAVYLQGQWKHPFEMSLTKQDDFYVTPQHANRVPFMTQTNEWMYHKGEKEECVTLPYLSGDQAGQFMTTFLVPTVPGDLKNLENELNEENWLKWQKEMQLKNVTLFLPRFRLEDRFNLGRILPEMGLKIAFTPEADFSGISAVKKLFINLASHRAIYRVDEKGSDLSTSLYNQVNNPSTSQNSEPPQEVRMNRPFIFIVWEARSRAIVLIGRVAQP